MIDAEEHPSATTHGRREVLEDRLTQIVAREGPMDLPRPSPSIETPEGDRRPLDRLRGGAAVVGEQEGVEGAAHGLFPTSG
jgi:hypothetical protein